jgi:hypothetical protein
MSNCQRCNSPLPQDAHHLVKYCGDDCRTQTIRERAGAWNSDNKDRRNANHKAKVEGWTKEEYAARMYRNLRKRAKASNIAFDLDVTDLVIPDVCPVLGIEISLISKGPGYRADGPSVDKLIPNLGYTKGNVRIISGRANRLKCDGTPEEMELVLKDLQQIYSSLLKGNE